MATARLLLLRRRPLPPPSPSPSPPALAQFLRFESTTRSSGDPSCPPPAPEQRHRRYPPPRPHEFSSPCDFLGSWKLASDPREAAARLERLRRDYGRQMKQLRVEYAHEMEMLRLEKQRKDDARREAARIANEERKKAKAAAAETRAAERRVIQEEFRQMLLVERAQKLESWRAKEKLREDRKAEEKELLRRQSSVWVAEESLEKAILTAIVQTTPL